MLLEETKGEVLRDPGRKPVSGKNSMCAPLPTIGLPDMVLCELTQARLGLQGPYLPPLSAYPQVFLWAPWMWCWTPVPVWPLTASCTRPRTRRSTGQWHVVSALNCDVTLGGRGQEICTLDG